MNDQNHQTRDCLLNQLNISWMLLEYHLNGLTTEECLWRPSSKGLHVHKTEDGRWHADWPNHEGYDIGPSSIAWTTWHICYWWSMAYNHSFGDGSLTKEVVSWPGDADALRAEFSTLHQQWKTALENLSDEDLSKTRHSKWPIQNQPFYNIAGWVNVELMKNAAELGYARFLYAVR